MKSSMFTEINRFLIAISLIATPINPYVAGFTMYLWIFLVILDTEFITKLMQVNIKKLAVILCWLIVALLELQFNMFVKLSVIFLAVIYLCLMDEQIFPKIRIAFIISCLFCVTQFVLFFIDPSLSASIAGENIGKLVWGDKYFTPAYINQYVILFLPRMGGLSREAGFFVSLLAIMILIILRRRKIGLKEKILYACSYLFSLSKVSIFVLLLFIITPFRNLINKISPIFTYIFVSGIFIFAANMLNIEKNNYVYANESIAHRFSSSYIISQLDYKSFFLGCNETATQCIEEKNNSFVDYFSDKDGLQPNTGLNGVWYQFGLLGMVLLLITFVVLDFKSFDIIMLVLITSTVTFMTVDNFLVLSYYYILTYDKWRYKKINQNSKV